jgi:AAA domain
MGCLIHQRRQSEEKARCGDSRLLGGTLWRRIALEGGTSMNDNPADGPAQSKIPPRDQDKPANVKPPLSFTFYRDIDPRPRKDWLIQNFIGQGELSCLYGHPGSSKSTIAGDLACHIAAKMNWFGRHTSQGGVLYVAAERVAVVKRRLAAFRKHHDLDDIPLAVVGGPADLRTSPAHAKLIVEYAARLEIDAKLPTVLIIIETINRVLAGGDENSSKDMGQLVRNLTDIQERTGAHILTVHHMPVDGERMRGHGSLLGACDVTVRAEKRSAMFTATIEKSNDGPTGERVAFTLKSVDLHHDEATGITTTAPVVVPTAEPTPKPSKAKLTPDARSMLRILQDAGREGMTTEVWFAAARAEDIGVKRRATLTDKKSELMNKQYVYEDNGVCRVWPTIQPTAGDGRALHVTGAEAPP